MPHYKTDHKKDFLKSDLKDETVTADSVFWTIPNLSGNNSEGAASQGGASDATADSSSHKYEGTSSLPQR